MRNNLKNILLSVVISLTVSCITMIIGINYVMKTSEKRYIEFKSNFEEKNDNIDLPDENTPTFNSSEVKYDNTNSGIQSNNVKGAIDELYVCASDYAAYNSRLTNAETTIGTGSLTTTSNTLIGGINELKTNIGTLSDLTTTDNNSVVAALNELNRKRLDRISTTAYNTNTISIDVSQFGGSDFPRLLLLEVRQWNSSTAAGAIGMYFWPGGEQSSVVVIGSTMSNVTGTVTAAGVVTLSWSGNWSYVRVVAFNA